jgi:hypothetical protein
VRLAALISTSLLVLLGGSARAIETSGDPIDTGIFSDVDPLETVLVTGEQPGPGLWKVSHGDHALWILGTHKPLPKKLTWRSKEIERLIAHSQEVLTEGNVDVDAHIGFFKGLALMPAAMSARKIPNGATLVDILTPGAYDRWFELRNKYIGRDGSVDKFRPTFAIQKLRVEALETAGLSYDSVVWPVVKRAARTHNVRIVSPDVPVDVRVEKPRALLEKFAKADWRDTECFVASLDKLEADVGVMRARANAWSIGDIAALRRLDDREPGDSCVQQMLDSVLAGALDEKLGSAGMIDQIRADVERAELEMRGKWLAAAEDALANNETTVALLPIDELVGPSGRLAKLREKGYQIEEP